MTDWYQSEGFQLSSVQVCLSVEMMTVCSERRFTALEPLGVSSIRAESRFQLWTPEDIKGRKTKLEVEVLTSESKLVLISDLVRLVPF